MSWRYQAKRVKAEFGDGYEYTVVEAFPGLESEVADVVPHTGAIRFYGKTPEALADWLHIAAADILMYDAIITDDEDRV